MKTKKARVFFSGVIAGLSCALVTMGLFSLEDVDRNSGLLSPHILRQLKHSHHPEKDREEKPENAKPNDTPARDLQKQIRILCWVYFRSTDDFEKRVHIARSSWAGKCTTFLVFITWHNTSLEAIGLDKVQESTPFSDSPTISINRYVYKNHYSDIDWFFLADSNPFVIMENLRYFLKDKDPDVPAYYGHRMRRMDTLPDLVFPDRCAGTILSKAGLRLLGTESQSVAVCNRHGNQEGMQFALCMRALGVLLGDSRDAEGRNRVLLFDLTVILADTEIDMSGFIDDELSTKPVSENLSPFLICWGRSFVEMNIGHEFFIYDLIVANQGMLPSVSSRRQPSSTTSLDTLRLAP